MKNSNIEWTDHTFNPWIGCTKVSPGCDHCYAEARMDKRLHKVQWGPGNPRQRTSEKYWEDPPAWNAAHEAFFAEHGRRQRVFCASLADVFDNEAPALWRQHLMSLVARTPNLDWLFLTKRIGNARKMLTEASMHDGLLLTADDQYQPPTNLWIGATITSQAEADRDIPKLLAVPAAKRFLSMEPLLGPVSLRWASAWPENAPYIAQSPIGHTNHLDGLRRLDWIIVGGESGPGARPMHPDWASSLRDQCQAAGVPFLFKQWGEWAPDEHFTRLPARDDCIHEWGEGQEITGRSWRMGKKAAGRMLDGRTWDAAP